MADSLCSIVSFEDRLPSLGQDRVAIFYEVSYVPVMLARLWGSCPPETREAFRDGYAFKIVIGKRCENCKPIWVLGKTWEDQPDSVDDEDNRRLLRDHIIGVYHVQIESLEAGTGFVHRGILTNLDKPEEMKYAGSAEYQRLPERITSMIRGNPFFREEPGFLPPVIQDPALLSALEQAAAESNL